MRYSLELRERATMVSVGGAADPVCLGHHPSVRRGARPRCEDSAPLGGVGRSIQSVLSGITMNREAYS